MVQVRHAKAAKRGWSSNTEGRSTAALGLARQPHKMGGPDGGDIANRPRRASNMSQNRHWRPLSRERPAHRKSRPKASRQRALGGARPVRPRRGTPHRCPSPWCRAGARPAPAAAARPRARHVALVAARGCRPAPRPHRPVRRAPRNSRTRRRGPHLRRRGDENLHVGIGADHGADVAAIEHRAGRRRREIALEASSAARTSGNGRHDRGRLTDRVALQRGLVERRRIDRIGGGDGARLVRSAVAGIEQAPSPPRDTAARCRDDATRNARRAACRACPCPTPPARRWR